MKTISNNFAPGISRIFGWMVLISEILTTFSWKILYHLPLCPNFRKVWLNGKRPRWKGRFHPRDPHPCKFIGTKQSVYTRKEFNSWTPTWLQFHQMATATSGENGLLWKMWKWRISSRLCRRNVWNITKDKMRQLILMILPCSQGTWP